MHAPATKQPMVMVRTDTMRVNDGKGRRRMTTAKIRLTSGVQRFTAPYMGIFIPVQNRNMRQKNIYSIHKKNNLKHTGFHQQSNFTGLSPITLISSAHKFPYT